ncbi:alpha/beta hydrolase [bacterium]|nr:alpha/beta hydrolase [bacterium]
MKDTITKEINSPAQNFDAVTSIEKETSYKSNRYFYQVHSKGKNLIDSVVFISGAFQNMGSWKRFVDHFVQFSRVILIDLPGTGKSALLDESMDFIFLSECIKNVLDEIRTNKINLLATSYGTPVACYFAYKYGDIVSHLVLGGTMKELPLSAKTPMEKSLEFLNENKMNEFINVVIDSLICKDEDKIVTKRNFVEKIMRKSLQKMSEDEKRKYLLNTKRLLSQKSIKIDRKINSKALVFTGEYDKFTKPEYCREVCNFISNCYFTTIKNSDHLYHLENRDVILNLLDSFLNDKSLHNMEGCNKIELLK